MDASQKAIRLLCKKYNVEVFDINSNQATMYESCVELYKHRAIDCQCELGKEIEALKPQPKHNLPVKVVHMDFFAFLKVITSKMGIPMGIIDVMVSNQNMFQACTELSYPSS